MGATMEPIAFLFGAIGVALFVQCLLLGQVALPWEVS